MTETTDAIPRPERTLIETFATQLADVDFAGLGVDTLQTRADEVMQAHSALEDLQAQARAARERLEARRAELRDVAKKALAYARVFARDNAELSESLDSIELEPKTQKKTRKRRTRKPKATTPAPAPQLNLDAKPADNPAIHLAAE